MILLYHLNHRYIEAVQNGEPIGILLKMAKDIGAPPALLARKVLEIHCEQDEPNGNLYI